MFLRNETRKIKIANNLYIGGQNKVLIQSMCNRKTSNIKAIINQINECDKLGADLMRVSILDAKDAKSLNIIKQNISLPLVADIHYSSYLGLLAIENGADKIRINPLNTPSSDLIKIIEKSKEYKVPIRIGINEGSIIKNNCLNINEKDNIVSACLDVINFFEKNNFYNLIISLKSSSPLKTIELYESIASKTDYPLHIGVTESGFDDIGIIRSTIALSNILLKGIGDTIRISLTKNPKLEILTAKRLLHDLNLYKDYPTIISCPTCGRCKVNNIKEICKQVTKFLEENNINIKISIMGCIVNGIGEASNCDLGIAGENHKFIIFKGKKILKKVNEKNLLYELFKIIKSNY